MFDKIKKFNKKHPNIIPCVVMGVTTVAGCAAAYYCGANFKARYPASNEAMNIIADVLYDMPVGTKIQAFGGIYADGVPAKELGELGAEMIRKGADESADLFTHFIAIRKMGT